MLAMPPPLSRARRRRSSQLFGSLSPGHHRTYTTPYRTARHAYASRAPTALGATPADTAGRRAIRRHAGQQRRYRHISGHMKDARHSSCAATRRYHAMPASQTASRVEYIDFRARRARRPTFRDERADRGVVSDYAFALRFPATESRQMPSLPVIS